VVVPSLVSIVLPTLNEELAEPIAILSSQLEDLAHRNFELIFVDDSRADVLARAAEKVRSAQLPSNVVARFIEGPRLGKGAAVRRGIEATAGEIVFLMDADLTVGLEHVEEFLGLIDQGADVVVAERPLDRTFGSPLRLALSRGLLLIQRALVFHSMRFSDTQCGFKAFRGELLRDLARQQIIDGGMYDLEYLYVAQRRGARIQTVTIVQSAERRESRVNPWKCLRRDPVDVARVKVHGMLGRYH
jgi:dolichyl-phosphate beta-glucosyltransferase